MRKIRDYKDFCFLVKYHYTNIKSKFIRKYNVAFLPCYKKAKQNFLNFIQDYTGLVYLIISLAILSAIPIYVHHSQEIPEEIKSPEQYIAIEEHVVSFSQRDAIDDEIMRLIEKIDGYSFPVSPESFVTGYTHYTVVKPTIEEDYKKNPEQTMAEVAALKQALEEVWIRNGVTDIKITLNVVEASSSDIIILTADSEGMYDNHDAQIKYIEGDEESYQAYIDYIETKENAELSGDFANSDLDNTLSENEE